MQDVKSVAAAWCMLLVRPGKERDVEKAFRRYSILAYWPHYQAATRWSPQSRRPSRTDSRSVIPGYLFVKGVFDNAFWEVTKVIEGAGNVVLNFSGEVAKLKEEDVDIIRKIERDMNTPVPGKTLHSFKTGDRVRFTDDLATRWPPGVIGGTHGDGRLMVEVEFMGRVVPFFVFPHQIERA